MGTLEERDIKYMPAIAVVEHPITGALIADYYWSDYTRDLSTVDTIVVHTMHAGIQDSDPTYDPKACRDRLVESQVSAHYMIARDGKIYQLVDDIRVAWQAGTSLMPDGRTAVNAFSLGIELISPEEGPIEDEQYNALVWLLAHIMQSCPIEWIVGHSDIAGPHVREDEPKTDLWHFDWQRLGRELDVFWAERNRPRPYIHQVDGVS